MPAAVLVPAVALAAWAGARAAVAGEIGDAAGIGLLLLGVVVGWALAARIPGAYRTAAVDAVLVIGVAAGLSGWVGVAWRLEPFVLESAGLWRAATTLTYANAAAGLLVPLALLALARRVGNPTARWPAANSWALLAAPPARSSPSG